MDFRKTAHVGAALAILSPVVALGFGAAVFFPVALTSAFGGVICLVCHALVGHSRLGRATSALAVDLAGADPQRRELVLSELSLSETERKWFDRQARKRIPRGRTASDLELARNQKAT